MFVSACTTLTACACHLCSLFGLLIVVTELKSWPIISTFQKRVDVYFHLLSVPRGKGG